MKTIKSIIWISSLTALSLAACMKTSEDTSDVMEDTSLNQDTAFRTDQPMAGDTFVPSDTDPRRQGIEDNLTKDSLRVKKPSSPN
jgi:hypothetical protein